ncbi:MAG: Rid family detoxifying hydrolase [Acidobacteriota bacterium]
MKTLILMLVLLAATACAPHPSTPAGATPTEPVAETAPPTPEFLNAPDAAGRNLPFSEAVRVGDMLYLSGKLGRVPGELRLAEGGIQPETRQTLTNIKDVLERHGSSMDRVVKCTVFLADIDEWASMNEVYKEFFPSNPPARSALGSSGLALDARVEIECIAVAGS